MALSDITQLSLEYELNTNEYYNSLSAAAKISLTNSALQQIANLYRAALKDDFQASTVGGSLPVSIPKTYVAVLSQSGTSNPSAVVLENGVGSIVWARQAQGVYTGTLVGAFSANKVVCLTTIGNPAAGNAKVSYLYRSTDDTITLETYGSGFTAVDVFNILQILVLIYP